MRSSVPWFVASTQAQTYQTMTDRPSQDHRTSCPRDLRAAACCRIRAQAKREAKKKKAMEIRRAKREAQVRFVKELYACVNAMGLALDPPDPEDTNISKRSWEHMYSIWRYSCWRLAHMGPQAALPLKPGPVPPGLFSRTKVCASEGNIGGPEGCMQSDAAHPQESMA